ncbi:hypothetical protein F5B18DRAFT_663295 [Nemania serpens]|nr:hypothetical protein F5B18DRAFT_663295 [Nemania serpens]
MSLGVESLWRARCCFCLVQGLSLLPGKSRHPLYGSRSQARCRLSSSSASSSASASATRVLGVLSPRTTAMIDPPVQHPDRRASRRNLRKHILSARRQALVEHARRTLRKPYDDWSWTLNLMIRHTPKFDEVLDFKVRIGGGTAAQARAAFSDLDKNLWQLQQRHHGRIQVESGLRDHEPLILSLSGTGVFVRESLSDLAKVVGDVLAVRVLDPTRPIPWPENERENERGEDGDQAEVASRVLGDGDSAGEGETVAVAHDAADFADMAQRPRNKIYRLTTRADEIPRPTVWTKSSFEQYVASLVFARVPTHLHQSLYPVGLSHQATVVHLLTMLFSSEDLRSAVSVSALKMALYFIQSRGRAFRPAARTIFYQVELQHLPLDAEAFQTFLTSASRAGDLQAFNSILTAMYRKGHRTQVATWTSFLAMIRDPGAIYVIVKKMRSRGLLQLRPILEQIGRRRVLLQLERRAHEDLNMLDLLHAQDRWYGPAWLDTMTLNRMVDILGACGNLRACYELLDTVDRDGRVRPDHYTLNTMMTHTRSIPQKITLLSRWPGLDPDGVTYQQLFQAAWKQRLPNVLRVIWRYSVFAGRTNSLMRWMLTKLMRSDSGSDSISDSAMSKNGSARSKRNPTIHKKKYTRSKKMATLRTSKKRVFLKAWEDVILGESQLAAGRLSVGRLSVSHGSPDAFGAWQLKKKYLEDAGPRRLLVRLESKLQEAYGVDMQIHKLNRQGIEMTSAMRKSLTVGIPLGMKSDRR